MKTFSKLMLGALAAATPVVAQAAPFVYDNSAPAYQFTLQSQYQPYVTGTITFDEATPTYTLGGTYVSPLPNSSSPNNYQAPAIGNNNGTVVFDTTHYLAAEPAGATLTGFGSQRYISLYWGSVDSYNSLDFFDANGGLIGTVSGMMIGPPANGNTTSADTNRRVLIDAGTSFTTLGFRTGQQAFEVDNIYFLSSVPEPASWAMMVGGFGLMGAALRRKKSVALFA